MRFFSGGRWEAFDEELGLGGGVDVERGIGGQGGVAGAVEDGHERGDVGANAGGEAGLAGERGELGLGGGGLAGGEGVSDEPGEPADVSLRRRARCSPGRRTRR